ncbi:hypothetical protein [Actinomycetospora chibensis]|uniref:Uncharacterized protein n=1 Tax=Actinomycetospora chibensis TaxID=663606 RepID=A0ABV9RG21_9PSEU|nr:hypothetical protein [Actinomycetospora chibensis]MDD7925010.1 hypothetical protein [Actinomycetospora chibensis]
MRAFIRERHIESVSTDDPEPFEFPYNISDPVKRQSYLIDYSDRVRNSEPNRRRYALSDFAGFMHPWEGDTATRLGMGQSLVEQKRAKGMG